MDNGDHRDTLRTGSLRAGGRPRRYQPWVGPRSEPRVRGHQARFARWHAVPVEETDVPQIVRAYYGLSADMITIGRVGGPRGLRTLPEKVGAAMSSGVMSTLGLLRGDYGERLDSFWNDLIARPKVVGSRVVQKAGDPLLSTEYGSFCLEFDLPATELSAVVFWQLRLLVRGRRVGEFPGTAFADGRSHVGLPDRDYYFVTLLHKERIVKIPVRRSRLLLDVPTEQVTTADLDRFRACFLELFVREPMNPFSASFDAGQAHLRSLSYQDREIAVTDVNRTEVADLRINLMDEDLPLEIVQLDRRALTANGTPVVLTVGPATRDGERRVVGKYHHTYSDGAVALAEARDLGERLLAIPPGTGAAFPGADRSPERFADPIEDRLRRRANIHRELIPVSLPHWGSITGARLDRLRYQQRITAVWNAARAEQHLPDGAKPEYEISIHLLLAISVLLLTGKESLHFLESVERGQSLAPSLLRIPDAVLEAIRSGDTPTPELREHVIAALKLWQIDRRETQQGKGVVPTMAVVSGALRRPLQWVGKMTDPGTTYDLTDTILLSMLVRGRMRKPSGGTRVHGFSTALALPYGHGAFGAIDTDDGQIMLSVRSQSRARSGVYGLTSERLRVIFEQVLQFTEQMFLPDPGTFAPARSGL